MLNAISSWYRSYPVLAPSALNSILLFTICGLMIVAIDDSGTPPAIAEDAPPSARERSSETKSETKSRKKKAVAATTSAAAPIERPARTTRRARRRAR